MAATEPTIVISKLDDKALQESIDKLVKDVDSKLNGESGLASKFKSGIEAMQNSLNTFATTIKTVKGDVGDMSKSFEAMFKAMSSTGGSGASGGGKGGTTSGTSTTTTASAPNTIGELKEQIKLQGQIVDQQVRSTAEKERQVNKQRQLTNELEKELRSTAQSRLQRGLNMQPQGLDEAQRKLQYLQAVQRRYANTTQLSAQEQKNLANAIARTQREIAKINNVRPKTLKEVLGMDESSVDAITRKMRELKRVQISDPAQVNDLSSAYQRLTDKRREMLGQNQLLENSNLSLARSFNYIRNRLVYAFTIGAVMNFTKELVRVRAEYEMLDRSLGILIGDMEKGTQIFNELNEMALKSPFTLIELGTAAKQLTAYNFAANEVVDTTRRLADISAALGVPMERLTYNLGQIKAQGVLNARDARDFANAGLAIVPMLAKLYTEQKRFGDEIVTTAQVYDMMSKKMVSYGDVLHVLTDITDEGGKFFDFQAKQADTLKVQLANLTLAWNNMLNEIGTDNQGILSDTLGMIRTLVQNWKTVRNTILTVVTALGAYKTIATIVDVLNRRMFFGRILVNIRNYITAIRTATGAMAAFNAVVRMNPLGLLVSVLATAGVAFLTFGNNVEEASEDVEMFGENSAKTLGRIRTIQKILAGLDENTATYKSAMQELNGILNEYGITEISNREEINEKIKQTIALIEEEASARQYANQMAKGEETYNKALEEANKELSSAYNDLFKHGFEYDKHMADQMANAFTSVTSQVIQSNIQRVVGKTGDEYEKGVKQIMSRIENAFRKMGYSELEISIIMKEMKGDIEDTIEEAQKATEAFNAHNETIEKTYSKGQKLSKGVLSFNQKLEAQKKVMRQASTDAKTLYDRIYSVVDLAKKNSKNTITFDLKLVASKPPAWMKNFSDERIRELATNFGAIASAGGRAKGMTREQTLRRSLEYASEYRLREEAKASEKDTNKTTKTRTKQTDEFAKAIKEVGNAMTNTRKKQQELLKEGIDGTTILNSISENYGKTIELNNKKLQSFGVKGLKTASDFANMGQREQKGYLLSLLDVAKLRGSAEAIEYLEGKLADLNEEILKTDNKTLIDSLNSELSRLKEEYELAIELDANPELGGIFEQLFDIDPSQLPRTVQEYSDMVTKALNEKLKERKMGVELADLLGMRKEKMDEFVNSLPKNSIWRDIITKAWKEIHEANKKAVTDAAKEWDKLVEKYGKIQDKLIRISKDGAQARFNVIKQFGSEEEKASSKTLIDNIMKEQDPQKIAVQMEELMKRVNAIIARNPNAKVVIDATINQTSKDISKAYWEDFKDSDLYSMTFENMSKNSTRAIQLIVDKLDLLKDKVKEDPASMKALTDSLNKAQDELVKRNPLKALVQSLGELKNARQGVKTATEALGTADGKVAYWEEQVKKLRNSGEDEKYIDAQDKLAKAKEKQAKAQVNLAQAENTERTAKEKMVDSLEATQQAMEATQGVFNALSNAFRAFGDDDTADMLGEIANGFAMIIPVVVAVAVAITTLERTSVILLAISAALATIIGLVSWLSGRSDKKIVEQIKDSERAVKELENTYKLLNNEAEDAYGTMVMGARQAVKANKELQLAELKRQLALEQSRDSKHRDEDRIIELRGQIIDLEREVNKATEETLNAILGISSHGDFFEDLISSMIDAFKQGEDAMKVFEEKWDEMIDNMIMKTIVQRFLSTWIDSLKQGAEDIINENTKDVSKEKADLASQISYVQGREDFEERARAIYNLDNEYYKELVKRVSGMDVPDLSSSFKQALWFYHEGGSDIAEKVVEAYYADAERQMKELDQKIAEKTLDATTDLIGYFGEAKEDFKTNYMPSIMEAIKENFTYGQDNEKELSALQRGIGSVTEETASAIEAYLNGVSQQVYYQSDILTQIRDTVQSFDIDVQTSTQAEMLLQLQQSYQVQMSIESILQGVLVPSGRAFAVEIQ